LSIPVFTTRNWSREKVIEYMHANDVNDTVAQSETDRYIAWPGQALAYKMGQLMIRKLRDEAKAQLGPKFDIKAFHDEILNGGSNAPGPATGARSGMD